LQIIRGFGDARQACHIVARGKRQAAINSHDKSSMSGQAAAVPPISPKLIRKHKLDRSQHECEKCVVAVQQHGFYRRRTDEIA
jgi:hypothetical protein